MAYAISAEEIKRAHFSQILIIFNTVFFIVFNLILGRMYHYTLLAQEKSAILNGEFWRLFTSVFTHWDIGHLINNMIGLLIYGAFLEDRFSGRKFLFLYFFSGLIGSTFTFFLTFTGVYSAGASGAIFGLMGSSFVILFKEDNRIYMYSLFYIIYSLVYSLRPNIGFFAHIFGLLTGLLIGYLYIKKEENQIKPQRTNDLYYN
ncbi:MAG: rhomboid family intramembrane serine protease [Promethearchaeota archaeon]